jgi:hypothetical protein
VCHKPEIGVSAANFLFCKNGSEQQEDSFAKALKTIWVLPRVLLPLLR